MTKAELVNEIAVQSGLDKTTVLTVVEGVMANIKNSLAGGESVFLRGFGSFINKKRAQKLARNISTHTSIIVPEHRVPYFKPAKEFVAQVR